MTASDRIFQHLSADIVSGKIAPGQKLDEQVLAQQFAVSRTPIREALRQLASAGLVASKAHRGVTAVNFDIAQLADMYEALEELEALAAKLAAERMTAVERKQLLKLHHDSAGPLAREQVDEFASFNEKFHNAVHRGARNQTLNEGIANLRQRLNPFRQPWLFRKRNRMQASFSEHELLTSAIVAGDKAGAGNAMRNHLSNTSLITLEYLAGKHGTGAA